MQHSLTFPNKLQTLIFSRVELLGGSWIRDPLAQNTLLDLLRRTEADNGWPWSFAMQKFSQDWRAPR